VQTGYSYDAGDRMTAVSQSYNGGAARQIAGYAYNELGQLMKKGLGSGNSYPYDIEKHAPITITTDLIAQNSITFN